MFTIYTTWKPEMLSIKKEKLIMIDYLTVTEINSLKETSKMIARIDRYLYSVKHEDGQIFFSVREKEYGFTEELNGVYYKYGVNWYDENVKIGVWVTIEDYSINELEQNQTKLGWEFKGFDNNLMVYKTKDLIEFVDVPFPENDFTAITEFLSETQKEAYDIMENLLKNKQNTND